MKLKPNKKLSGIYFPQKQILIFPNRFDVINDDDIIDLFLGLVKLIKKSVEIKVEKHYLNKISILKNEIERLQKNIKFI